MIPAAPPPPPPRREIATELAAERPRALEQESVAMLGHGDDINADKVRAVIQRKRADSGMRPTQRLEIVRVSDSDEVDSKRVMEMLRQTRACAIQNAQRAESLKEAQTSAPKPDACTTRFKTRALPGAPRVSVEEEAPQGKKKEQRPS